VATRSVDTFVAAITRSISLSMLPRRSHAIAFSHARESTGVHGSGFAEGPSIPAVYSTDSCPPLRSSR
jgi:hypothetical protein